MTSRFVRVLAVVLVLCTASCGESSSPDPGPDASVDASGVDASSGADAGVVEDAGADAGGADAASGPTSRCEANVFVHDAVSRRYILCVPDPTPAGALPVVLGFHGGGGHAALWQRTLPWHETGAREGFVVVFMQGCQAGELDCSAATGTFVWNVGKPGEPTTVDDQGYTLAVLDRLSTEHALSIDRARVFATGHSLGGIFTYSLRCDHPDVFAAIGPVSAPPSDATCTLAGNTSIYHVHGTADANVPFDTGCCSRAQQTMLGPEYLPGCATLPRCFNPLNWWPPVRNGVHPYADLVGLEEMATMGLGCAATRSPIAELPGCARYDGCRAEAHAEECLVAGVDHTLSEIDAAFDLRAYLWSRFRAE